MAIKAKQTILFLGDILMLYAALAITLLVRYGYSVWTAEWSAHVVPFSFIFVIWIIVFYLLDLYKNRSLGLAASTIQSSFLAVGISALVSVTAFYLFQGFFKLTPKTNLFIFSATYLVLGLVWRYLLSQIYVSSGFRSRVIFIGDSSIVHELAHHLFNAPQLGYITVRHIKEYDKETLEKEIKDAINSEHADTLVIQSHITKDPTITKIIYRLLSSPVNIIDLTSFYETIFQKVPLEELEERWFIEKLPLQRKFYDSVKRIIDILVALALLVILLPLIVIIAVLIKLTSKGPAIYKQERIGMGDTPFILHKFRTMKTDRQGPLWTEKNDPRLTIIGRVLRFTHLDEIPQLYNVLKGNISFVGPRPERRELAEQYSQLTYYEMRHTIKPGLTGWAQVNFGPSASLEEALEKLKYDMFYIKNRSLALDFLIILRTIKMFLFNY